MQIRESFGVIREINKQADVIGSLPNIRFQDNVTGTKENDRQMRQ